MFILNFIPNWFFQLLALVALVVFLISRYIKLAQAQLVNYASIGVFSLAVFMSGANFNNEHWLEKLRLETSKVEQLAKQQEIVNQQLESERKEKLANIQQAAQRERELNKKFIDVLKSKDATVQNVLATLSKAEQDKYAALNAKDRAAADKKLQDVRDNAKACPNVPELYLERLNNTAKGLK
jgi:uncharacterized protein YdiU (UPF0061 family)